jgi:hypothetical protein
MLIEERTGDITRRIKPQQVNAQRVIHLMDGAVA